jgi:hypothetical protein
METYWRVDEYIYVVLTLTVVGGVWSASRHGRFIRGETPGIHWIGGWVGPRAGLDNMEKRIFFFSIIIHI